MPPIIWNGTEINEGEHIVFNNTELAEVRVNSVTVWEYSTTPIGSIVATQSSTVPEGWALCDGTNGTPDLRDKFIIGAGSSYAAGAVGGSKDATVISHAHGYTTSSNGYHNHSSLELSSEGPTHAHGSNYQAAEIEGGAAFDVSFDEYFDSTTNTNTDTRSHSHNITGQVGEAGGHSHSVYVGTSGESGTDKNLPPYYALYFIMKVL